jgi:hypothetical protein
MRAIIVLAYIGIVVLGFCFGALTGMLVTAAVSLLLIAGLFLFSTDRREAMESREMRRAMGRNTTFLAGLPESKD